MKRREVDRLIPSLRLPQSLKKPPTPARFFHWIEIWRNPMPVALASLLLLYANPPAPIETQMIQVAHQTRSTGGPEQPRRAVVLVTGLAIHPFNKRKVGLPMFDPWQLPNRPLVNQLALEADVFSFAYAQTVPVHQIAEAGHFEVFVRRLRQDGYKEIVLIGYSAGALVVRQFVEDHPDSGVTKVLQVCPPNAGSSWAVLATCPSNQIEFLWSLTKTSRRAQLSRRANVIIPSAVEFACVLGTSMIGGDGIVLARCQWSEDLQRQGIPVYPVHTGHREAMDNPRVIELVNRLVREPLPRWQPDKVKQACHSIR
jgi:hypothetical protein